MKDLYKKLYELNNSSFYPFHMPGHKRKSSDKEADFFKVFKSLDITEITNFDDLHNATGIIRDIERKAAKLYGADDAFLLINGSTAGILAVLSAVLERNKRIVFGRNSHKAAYNGLFLNDAKPDYIWLDEFTKPTICSDVNVNAVEKQIKALCEKGVGCPSSVYITSPTYEGIISDIDSIAACAHKYNLPLIVDAAHGAHMGPFAKVDAKALEAMDNTDCIMTSDIDIMSKNPINCGADVAIVSLHKTLNAPTQTGLLLIKGNRIDREKIKKYLSIYQSTSPSYPLMAGIENCIEELLNEGNDKFSIYYNMLRNFYDATFDLKFFNILNDCAYSKDPGKIVISIPNDKYMENIKSGMDLLKLLHDEYKIELEYASNDYAIAMTSYMDTEEGFFRLSNALHDIEEKYEVKRKNVSKYKQLKYPKPEIAMDIKMAATMDKEMVLIEESKGRIASDYIYAYPPGIPIIVPGEVIDEAVVSAIYAKLDSGVAMRGINHGKISVVIAD